MKNVILIFILFHFNQLLSQSYNPQNHPPIGLDIPVDVGPFYIYPTGTVPVWDENTQTWEYELEIKNALNMEFVLAKPPFEYPYCEYSSDDIIGIIPPRTAFSLSDLWDNDGSAFNLHHTFVVNIYPDSRKESMVFESQHQPLIKLLKPLVDLAYSKAFNLFINNYFPSKEIDVSLSTDIKNQLESSFANFLDGNNLILTAEFLRDVLVNYIQTNGQLIIDGNFELILNSIDPNYDTTISREDAFQFIIDETASYILSEDFLEMIGATVLGMAIDKINISIDFFNGVTGIVDYQTFKNLSLCIKFDFLDNVPSISNLSINNNTISWESFDIDNDYLIHDVYLKGPNDLSFIKLNSEGIVGNSFEIPFSLDQGQYEYYVNVRYPDNYPIRIDDALCAAYLNQNLCNNFRSSAIKTFEINIPTCSDGIQNGDETDIDCGGSCISCDEKMCSDGLFNGSEESLDCGGTVCSPCPENVNCPSLTNFEDGIYAYDLNYLFLSWSEVPGAVGYKIKIGDCSQCDNILPFKDVNSQTSFVLSSNNSEYSFPLQENQPIYYTIEAYDSNGSPLNECPEKKFNQCYFEELVFTSQSELDAFTDNYCNVILGDLIIQNSQDIVDLSNLRHIDFISGSIKIINNSSLRNLDGLNIKGIGNDLIVEGNSELRNISSIARLEKKLNSIVIVNNPELSTLKGLENIKEVNLIRIENNDFLYNLDGLNNLRNIYNYARITGNSNLSNFSGIDSLSNAYSFDLIIEGNPNLNDLSALDFLKVMSEYDKISIRNNIKLESLFGLHNLVECGEIAIIENGTLNNCSLPSLRSAKKVIIAFNNILESIGDFGSLISCNEIYIEYNTKLKNLYGFGNLILNEKIDINNNDSLEIIDAFNSMQDASDIAISANNNLIDLHGFSNLSNVYGVTIDYNERIDSILNFDNLSYARFISIKANSNLMSISGFNKLDNIGTLDIAYNPELTQIEGFVNLVYVDFQLFLNENPKLGNNISFNKVKSIGDDFLIYNLGIDSFNFIKGLENIGGHFSINQCPNLLSLSGIVSLKELNGLTIISCENLTSLNGLASLDTINGGVLISNNPGLNYCSIDPICDFINTQPASSITINNNNGDCLDLQIVSDLCANIIYGCTDPSAHNYNPAATIDDGSCETCSDGILNGDETGIDCGGLLCEPCITLPQCQDIHLNLWDYDYTSGIYLLSVNNLVNNAYDYKLSVRRLSSCIDFDWTTQGACLDQVGNGIVTSADRGTTYANCLPIALCDDVIPYQVRIIDDIGNIYYCEGTVNVTQYIPGCTTFPSHNYNPQATVNDGSCETCTDGIQNGDETGIDCGGILCLPCNSKPELVSISTESLIFNYPTQIEMELPNLTNIKIWGEMSGFHTGTFSRNGTQMTFIPDFNFLPGEKLQITSKSQLQDANGNFVTPWVWENYVPVTNETTATFIETYTGIQLPLESVANSTNISASDFNKDGLMDIVVRYHSAYGNPTKIYIILQNIDGTYGTPVLYSNSYSHSGFRGTPDLNNDGYPDLLITHNVPSSVHVRLNNGDGTFGAATIYAITSYSGGVTFGDIDCDGDLDIVGKSGNASLTANTISILRNNGNGSFAAQETINTSVFGQGLELGDFDNDGDFDFVYTSSTAYSSTATWQIYKNDGNGNFSLHSSEPNPDRTYPNKVVDFDGDGMLDILVLNPGVGKISIDSGINIPLSSFSSITNEETRMYPGDLDGDGDLDLFQYRKNNGTDWTSLPLKTWLQYGNMQFDTASGYINVSAKPANQLADQDGDGDLDFLYMKSDGKIYYAKNTNCVITCTTLDDGLPGSLRYAIDCAQPGDTIGFDPVLSNDTIFLDANELSLDKELYLIVPEAVNIILKGSMSGLLMHIEPTGDIFIDGIQIIASSGISSPSILNEGNLTLKNVNIIQDILDQDLRVIIENLGNLKILGDTKFLQKERP